MIPTSGPAAKYIDSLRSSNYSPNTIYSRGRAIVRFRLATGLDPLEIDQDRMIGWWTSLHLSPSSRAGELAAIRGYCKWAVKHDLIVNDPTRLIDRPRIPRRVPRPIDEQALGEAMGAAPTDVLIILTLAAFCGLRAMEISGLEWSDVRRSSLLLHGKGSKERVVPLHPLAAEAMNRLTGRHRGPVLTRRNGQPGRVPPHLICLWANTHLHGLGFPETLHQLRHRFGSQMYQLSNGDIRMVQDLLGHSSPVTTALYSAWDVKQATVVMSRLPTPA